MKKFRSLLIGAGLITILCLSCASASNPAPAKETIQSIDMKIAEFLDNSQKLGSCDENGRWNDKFVAYMKQILTDPRLLTADLPHATQGDLRSFASKDGLIRFYSWDSNMGGTMHFFYDFVQWKGAKGTHFRQLHPIAHEGDGGDCGYFYHDVHSIRTTDGKTIYMPTYRGVYSHPEHSDGITAYAIQGDALVEVPFFQAKKKLLTSIDVPASEVEWDERDLIKFKDNDRTLLIPWTDKERQLTGKYITYRFNGQKFVFDEKAHEHAPTAQ